MQESKIQNFPGAMPPDPYSKSMLSVVYILCQNRPTLSHFKLCCYDNVHDTCMEDHILKAKPPILIIILVDQCLAVYLHVATSSIAI